MMTLTYMYMRNTLELLSEERGERENSPIESCKTC